MEALADHEQWIVDGDKAMSVSLYAPSKSAGAGLRQLETFTPKFTDTIFEDGKIFGYKGLKINIRYRANDMRPHVKISHTEKLKDFGEREPHNIGAILEEGYHLPKVAFVRSAEFEKDSKEQDEDWTPPGTLHDTFDGPDGQYEVWRGNLQDPQVQQLNSRVQVFVMMYIRNGSYIGHNNDPESDEPDFSDADRWTLFFLYKKNKSEDNPAKSSYVFVGYSSVYRFFFFKPQTPPASPKEDWELPTETVEFDELPSRTRLSQFIILPPFQGKGKGIQLYNTIFKYYHKQPQTQEFVVEDPSEAFDDLRDICDLAFLRTFPDFHGIHLNAEVTIPKKGPIPGLLAGPSTEEVRRKAKIAPRQFARVLEMHLMANLPLSVRPSMDEVDDVAEPTEKDEHLSRLWQLLTKQRLYRHNRGVMHEIPAEDRPEALQNTLESVEYGYAAVLAAYERASKHWEGGSSGKRKFDGDDAEEVESQNKKTKVDGA